MRTLFSFFLLLSILTISAQDNNDEVKKETEYNRWSLEFNVGQNKPVRPFSPGYYSSDPSRYLNFSDINHFDFGVRYMISNIFGLKMDVAYDGMENQSGSGSLPFETVQYRIGLQGVANLGRVMRFETFTKRLNLLGHFGIHASRFEVKSGINESLTEDNGGIIIGLTPQFRISNRFVITGDFSALSNVRQHYSWDGLSTAAGDNLSGLMYNVSLGLTVYLGKKDVHADWYIPVIVAEDSESRKRLDELEAKLVDTDKDGVPDHLDLQNDTPNGVAVDSRGRFIDLNNNGIPDELEPKDGKDGVNTSLVSQSDAIKILVEKGYVNVFYDVNEDDPNSGSTDNVYYIINFLKNYPDVKAKLVGYADVRGNEADNKDLSKRRAQKLYDIIVASGINASRLSVDGEGVDNSFPKTRTGLDLARRVSIILE